MDENAEKKNREKRIFFCIEYRYPEEMPDDVILDRFAQQILDDAATVNSEDIHIINEDEHAIHCPKCGEELRKISKETVARITGIIEYDTYCDKCDITVSIEDRSVFEQEGNIIITFA